MWKEVVSGMQSVEYLHMPIGMDITCLHTYYAFKLAWSLFYSYYYFLVIRNNKNYKRK